MNSELVAGLRGMLRSTNRHERAEAAIGLGQAGVEDILPELEELIKEDDGVVSVAGMYATWLIAGRGVEVRRMIDFVLSGEEEVIQMVVEVVSSIGEPLVEELGRCLEGAEEEVMVALELLDEAGGNKARQVVEEFAGKSPEAVGLREKLLAEWDGGNND
ncbi:MAG: hypothetical protein ACSHYF_06940 [Verrucomicrobiaceae bacterium]